MTRPIRNVMVLAAHCERVFALLTDPEAMEALEKELGAKVVRCEREQRDDGGVVFRVYQEKPGHGADGTLAASTRTTTWQPDGMRATWVHLQHGQEKRSRAEGTIRLLAQEDGCRVTFEGEIEIRVPIVGKFIEKKIVEAFEAERDVQLRFLQQRLKEAR